MPKRPVLLTSAKTVFLVSSLMKRTKDCAVAAAPEAGGTGRMVRSMTSVGLRFT